jgi:hypothetical protein
MNLNEQTKKRAAKNEAEDDWEDMEDDSNVKQRKIVKAKRKVQDPAGQKEGNSDMECEDS